MSDTSFHELPADFFPLKMEFLRDEEVVHTIDVDGPGAVIIPALGTPEDPVIVRVTFADGTTITGAHADKFVT